MSFMELADYVVAGLALLTGLGVGRRMKPRPKVLARARAECACGHGFGQHEDGKKCKGDSKRANGWDNFGDASHWVWVPCTCALYDGPDPELVRMLQA